MMDLNNKIQIKTNKNNKNHCKKHLLLNQGINNNNKNHKSRMLIKNEKKLTLISFTKIINIKIIF